MNYSTSRRWAHALFGLLWIVGATGAQAGSVQFSYTTPSAGTTSAGIYDTGTGTLLRTLWSNEPTPAGPNTAIWNGLDDEGIPVAPGTYALKVLHSNVTYTWEGVLGNTSTDANGNIATTGDTIRRSFKPTADLAITGSDMFFANGYNEKKSLFDRSLTSRPNAVDYYGPDLESSRNVQHVATDGVRFYVVQGGNSLNGTSFVSAFNIAYNPTPPPAAEIPNQFPFPQGSDTTNDGQVLWKKVIDLESPETYDIDPTNTNTTTDMKEVTDSAIKAISIARRTDVVCLTGREKAPTGIAVQPGSGSYLFVSHGSVPRPSSGYVLPSDYVQPTAYYNEIRVFNKTTGERKTASTYTHANMREPGRMVADNSGGLWVICKTSAGVPVIRKYSVNASTGALTPVAGAEITGLSAPVALALSPDYATLLVADSGASQQVKAFTVSSGLPVVLWTTPLGVAGGYNSANGSAAANNKFHFWVPTKLRAVDLNLDNDSETEGEADYPTMIPASCLAFESDGTFWVGDPGNERLQHFYFNKTYKDNIMFLSSTYQASICNGDPNRIFAGWLEFSINYSAADLQHGWTFVRNWASGLSSFDEAGGINSKPGFATVTTLSTRVYGSDANQRIYELQTSGNTRPAGTLPSSPNQILHEDGSLRWAVNTNTKTSYFKRSFASLDGSNNPTWGATSQVATSPISASGPVTNTGGRGAMGYKHPTTTSGLLVFSDASDARFHLGAIAQNGTALSPLKWRTAPSGRYFDMHGTIGTTGDYPCNNAFTLGNHIILGAHGEGSSDIVGRVYQANQFLHYWDNGLMVGQFGSPINYRYIKEYDDNNGRPAGVNEGRAGNAFAISMATVGLNTYLYHNDESQSSGIHRWKINNLGSVAVLAPPNAPATVTLPAGSNGTGLTAQYFTGTNFDLLAATGPVADVNIDWMATAPVPELPADNFSIRYSGLIEAKYTENYTFTVNRGANDKARLWINDVIVADGWSSTGPLVSGPVPLIEGKKTNLLLEYASTTGNASVSLKWASANQAAGVVPFQNLYPSGARSFNFGVVDLVEADNNSIGRWEPQPIALGNLGRSTGVNIDTSSVVQPAPMSVYQDTRSGGFQMGLIDLEPYTQYRVRLHLAEFSYAGSPINGPGQRVFNATVPDAAVIKSGTGAVAADLVVKSGIDIFALAGGKNKAVTSDYIVSTDNAGHLKLGIANVLSSALIGGLEISRDGSTVPSFPPIGTGTGLKGEYHDGDLTGPLVTTRVDQDVNFEWTPANLPPVTGTTNTNYTVRWTGKILTTKAGNYVFRVEVGDSSNFRLTLPGVNSGTPIIDKWTTAGTTQTSANVRLDGSKLYDVILEYKQTTNASNVALKWKLPTGTSQYSVIPRSQLYNDYVAEPPTNPGNPVEVTVDNTDASVTVTGTWGTGSASGRYGTNYLHDNANSKTTLKTVEYVPTLPEAGLYEVKTIFVGGSTRANNVPYIVNHAGGSTTVYVDQTPVLAANTWVSLGSFYFNAGTTGKVTIANTGTASGKYVIADAVRFAKP